MVRAAHAVSHHALQARALTSSNVVIDSPKQRYLAVCERVEVDGVTSSQISVFDLRTAPLFQKMRTLTNPVRPSNGKASDIIGCAFSGDSKFLACQTGRPDWTVMIWHWFQSRVICSVEVPARVSRVTFNPVDSSQICTSGPSHFRLWRVMDEALRPFPPFAGVKGTEHIVDHDWCVLCSWPQEHAQLTCCACAVV